MGKKKSNLQKKKDNPNSLYWKAKALKLWTEICRIRFNYECAICSTTNKLEAHHIISKKACKSLTFSIDNQILLCTYHHNWFGTEQYKFSAHKHPLKFYDYIKKNYPDIYYDVWAIDIEQEKQKKTTTKEYFLILSKIKEGILEELENE